MSVENNNREFFEIVWVGNESDKNKIEIKLSNEFENLDDLKEFLFDKFDGSIIVILSNKISLDKFSPVDYPQICAVYDDQLVCLYCLSTKVSSVDRFIKKNEENKLKKESSSVIPFIRKYWFIMGLCIAICLAYLFPNIGKTGGYIRSEWTIKWGSVIFIFFLSGLSLQSRQIGKELIRIRLHILVQLYSLLIIPFIIYGIVLLLSRSSMNKTLLVGIIIMGSTSTTISSNVVMTKNALGNEYAALLNAVIGNIFGIFISPALIYYFMKNPIFNSLSNIDNTEGQIDYFHVIQNLCLSVLIPLFIGQIIHLIWTKQIMNLREKLYFTELNSLALLTLLWAGFCNAFANKAFQTIQKKDLFILILINASFYITFSLLIMFIARLPIRYWQFSQKDTVAIMFCGATKTLAMGIPLINALYGNKTREITGLLSIPLIMYHVEQLIIGAFQVILLKKWIETTLKKQTSTHKHISSKNQDNIEITETQTINIKS